MRSDSDIRDDVEKALRSDPETDAAGIAVAVKDGIVELTGSTPRLIQKWRAERDAKRVGGVRGVANELHVRNFVTETVPATELVRSAVAEIETALPFGHAPIKVAADDAWLTLDGHIEWNYQRERAEAAIHRLKGVRGVSNFIGIAPRPRIDEIRRRIEQALKARARREAGQAGTPMLAAWARPQSAEPAKAPSEKSP